MSGYWPQTDQVGTSIAPPIAAGPPTGIAENFDAAINDQLLLNNSISKNTVLTDAYSERANEVYKATGQRLANPILHGELEAHFSPLTSHDTVLQNNIDNFEKQVDALRAQHPTLTTQQDMWKNISAMAGAVEGEAADVSDRATLLGKIGSFAGQMSGAMTDPVNLVTLPLGAPASAGILRTALIEAGIGAGVESVIQPDVQEFRKQAGLDSGFVPALENVTAAAGGRAVIGAGIKAVARGLETPAGRSMTGAVNDAAGYVKDIAGKKLVNLFDNTIKVPTPDQQLARDMQAHISDVNASSPLDAAAPGAIEEHNSRLTQVMQALQADQPVEIPETPAAPVSQGTLKSETGRLGDMMNSFSPSDIRTDAKTFQFKEGGNASGVTDRLQGVEQWDPVKAGMVIVYENNAGEKFIADGHQRLGLAQRIAAQNPDANITLYGPLFREADGYTPEAVRVVAAMKNIAEGTGSAVDAAKVLRVDPARLSELPRNSQLVRQAGDMVNLTDNSFGYVVNELVPANQAAIVGRLVKEPALQDVIMGLLAKVEPENAAQAEAVVRQAMEAGTHTEIQHSLFGEEAVTSSLYLERAKVLDKALKKLRLERKVFQTLVDNATLAESEGNVLNTTTNAARAETDGRAGQMIQTLANRKGALSDALTVAAKRAADEGKFTNATADFVAAVRSAAERGDFNGIASGDHGRLPETAHESQPAAGHAAETSPDTASLKLFDEPAGEGSRSQARALEADIKRQASATPEGESAGAPAKENSAILDQEIPVGERVDEHGNVVPETKTVREMLDEIDQDAKDLDAIGKCGAP